MVDRDGTIYQLVPVGIMCRHTVGLNWTAIGIEQDMRVYRRRLAALGGLLMADRARRAGDGKHSRTAESYGETTTVPHPGYDVRRIRATIDRRPTAEPDTDTRRTQ